jgi:hypothetical protein
VRRNDSFLSSNPRPPLLLGLLVVVEPAMAPQGLCVANHAQVLRQLDGCLIQHAAPIG